MQYTLRNIPPHVDALVRRRAAQERRSLNEVAIEALARGLGISEDRVRHRDLGDTAGTWVEDPGFDRALEEQDQVDEEAWR